MSPLTRRIILLVSILACLCIAYTAGFGAYRTWSDRRRRPSDTKAVSFGIFWEAWEYLDQYFYGDPVSPQERTYGAIRQALTLLDDPYTIFVEPQPHELERDIMRGSFGGIGVTLWRSPEGDVLISPQPDSPAERTGLLEGDLLLALDNQPLSVEMTIDDVYAWLHGEVGSTITLTISRPPTPPFDVPIVRDLIYVPSISWRVLDRDRSIGYIHIQSITERTNDEISLALQELLQPLAVSGLILDLRDNSGGLLNPTVAVASQFLREGIVLTELRRDGQERKFPVRTGGIATEVPLIVLVNNGTASAAEIIAGAIQDHRRGLLVGETTYGKGSVQQVYDLSDGSSLHVTSAVWMTPHQHPIEGAGLMPDHLVLRGDNPAVDEQIEYAVTILLDDLNP